MKEYQIHLSDWGRIFTGGVPATMYVELVFRAVYLFLLIIVSMRLLGKRMASQLSRNDMAALVALAAAIGVPLVAFDRGLLPSTVIAVVVVGIARLMAIGNARNHSFERAVIGRTSALVKNGVMDAKEMVRCRMSRERVFSELRSEHVLHLGEIKRLYLETTGSFSVIPERDPKPGLLILPAADKEFVDEKVAFTDQVICLQCGNPQPAANADGHATCDNCGEDDFTKAVVSKN